MFDQFKGNIRLAGEAHEASKQTIKSVFKDLPSTVGVFCVGMAGSVFIADWALVKARYFAGAFALVGCVLIWVGRNRR